MGCPLASKIATVSDSVVNGVRLSSLLLFEPAIVRPVKVNVLGRPVPVSIPPLSTSRTLATGESIV